jgi:hypothetical protein
MANYIYDEIEIGDIVECIRVYSGSSDPIIRNFTLGKFYKIIEKTSKYFCVLNDDGDELQIDAKSPMSQKAFKKSVKKEINFLDMLKRY